MCVCLPPGSRCCRNSRKPARKFMNAIGLLKFRVWMGIKAGSSPHRFSLANLPELLWGSAFRRFCAHIVACSSQHLVARGRWLQNSPALAWWHGSHHTHDHQNLDGVASAAGLYLSVGGDAPSTRVPRKRFCSRVVRNCWHPCRFEKVQVKNLSRSNHGLWTKASPCSGPPCCRDLSFRS